MFKSLFPIVWVRSLTATLFLYGLEKYNLNIYTNSLSSTSFVNLLKTVDIGLKLLMPAIANKL